MFFESTLDYDVRDGNALGGMLASFLQTRDVRSPTANLPPSSTEQEFVTRMEVSFNALPWSSERIGQSVDVPTPPRQPNVGATPTSSVELAAMHAQAISTFVSNPVRIGRG
jgi:hypothetical protein